ncbi:MAG TPA: hypothetical protein VKB19_07795 [Pedobacter sp.]|nr:hypothetical protein [Pedobacter sp.]
MKKLFLAGIICFWVSTSTFAQVQKEKSKQSNLETFSEQSGSFSKKEIIELGKVGALSVSIIKISDIITGKGISGIKFSGYTGSGSYSTQKSAFLDKDEVANFLKAVSYINEKVFDSPLPLDNEEYNYYARGSFSGGAFSSAKEWKGYLSLDNYSGSTFFFKKEDFKKIIDIIEQNQSKI